MFEVLLRVLLKYQWCDTAYQIIIAFFFSSSGIGNCSDFEDVAINLEDQHVLMLLQQLWSDPGLLRSDHWEPDSCLMCVKGVTDALKLAGRGLIFLGICTWLIYMLPRLKSFFFPVCQELPDSTYIQMTIFILI